MPQENALPWNREYLEARQLSHSINEAVCQLEIALGTATDPFMRGEISHALAKARTARSRAHQIFKEQSLKHAEQVELIGEEG